MFKTNQTTQQFLSRKTSNTQNLTTARSQNIQLPCPNHPQYSISHVCLFTSCQQNSQFCSECLFEQAQQQHIAKHKEHVIGWQDFIKLCKRMSVSGRLGDALGDSHKSKDAMTLVLQTQVHQQQFKQHLKAQEILINQDFDKLIQQFTNDVNKVKNDMMNQLKLYQQELFELGKVVEKIIQEYYQHKGETKDYNNDFDNFLRDITQLQDQIVQQEAKQLRQSLPSIPPPGQQVYFNLKKLMQNIIPLVSRANSSFQKSLANQDTPDNQSSASGLTLFSSFSSKNNENTMITDIIQEYKTLLDNRPSYKNQGVAQQAYHQVTDQLQKIYHSLNEGIQHFVTPHFKSIFKNIKYQNKENSSAEKLPQRSKAFNSPLRVSLQNQQLMKTQDIQSCNKQATEKSSIFIESYLKQQQSKQLKSMILKQEDSVQDEDYQEQITKQQFIKQVNQGHLMLEQETAEFVSLDHKKTIATSHKGGINCLQLIDEDYVATGSNDKTLKIWRLGNFELIKEVQFKSDVTAIATLIRPDGSSMLIVGLYRQICLLNQSFEIIRYFDSQPSFIDKDSQLKVVTINFDIAQNQIVQQIVHNGQINALLPTSDCQSVLSCSQGDNKIVQWNLFDPNQTQPKKYFDHRDTVTCMTNVNGDSQVASAGKDRTIKLYSLVFHEKEFKNGSLDKLQLSLSIADAHLTEITALNSSPHPSVLLSMCSTGELKVWDCGDGSLIRTIKNYCGWGYRILFLYQAIVTKEPLNEMFRSTKRQIGSPQRSKMQKSLPNQFKKSHLITFSFDGTMKVFDCQKFFDENISNNYEPIIQIQTKSLLDCHPFGGVLMIKDQLNQNIEIMTTGNKNDPNIQIYGLKEA